MKSPSKCKGREKKSCQRMYPYCMRTRSGKRKSYCRTRGKTRRKSL